MRHLVRAQTFTLTAVLATVLSIPAATSRGADTGADTDLTTTLADRAYIGTRRPLTATLRSSDGAPVSGATLELQRDVDGVWTAIGRVVTDADGQARRDVEVRRTNNRFRVVWDAPEGSPHQSTISAVEIVVAVKAPTTVSLEGPTSVVDERSTTISIRWSSVDGRPVTGAVRLLVRHHRSDWTLARTPRVVSGRVTVAVRPPVDTTWRVSAPGGAWWRGSDSTRHRIDNLPPAAPVRYPAAAPDPRVKVAVQRRAVGPGMSPAVSHIPAGVWRTMVGRTWHRGCPVGRAGLRLIRLNYWGFDGYRHRGELVVAVGVARPTVRVFAELYQQRMRIRSMYRVDRFGWSERLQGGNDYRSMAADNTSAFNCRQVVGSPGRLSFHSYGTSIDVNPWENPYRSAEGVEPNAWWDSRRKPRSVVYRSWSHPVVQAFADHGFRWLGSTDWQHFEVGRRP